MTREMAHFKVGIHIGEHERFNPPHIFRKHALEQLWLLSYGDRAELYEELKWWQAYSVDYLSTTNSHLQGVTFRLVSSQPTPLLHGQMRLLAKAPVSSCTLKSLHPKPQPACGYPNLAYLANPAHLSLVLTVVFCAVVRTCH